MVSDDWIPPRPSQAKDTIHNTYYLGSKDPLIESLEYKDMMERTLQSTNRRSTEDKSLRQSWTKRRVSREEKQKKKSIWNY